MSTYRIIEVQQAADLASYRESDVYKGFDAQLLAYHAVDRHCVLLDSQGVPQARCSLWWRETPPLAIHRIGAIGHYAAVDRNAAVTLLQHACTLLADNGADLAVGPMDGNTWRRYRFITERGSEPPFFLEPDNPDHDASDWQAAGFATNAEYYSALAPDLSVEDPRMPRVAQRMQDNGVTLRPLNPQHFDAELQRIFDISLISFRNNYLYTPINTQEFLTSYRKVQPYIQPELTLLAEHENKPVGFLFALPDMLQAQRGGKPDTVIIKTVAVLPQTQYAGLGGLLVGSAQQIARKLGYRRAIHALMFESNTSRNISRHYAQTMRRYTLFSKALT